MALLPAACPQQPARSTRWRRLGRSGRLLAGRSVRMCPAVLFRSAAALGGARWQLRLSAAVASRLAAEVAVVPPVVCAL